MTLLVDSINVDKTKKNPKNLAVRNKRFTFATANYGYAHSGRQ